MKGEKIRLVPNPANNNKLQQGGLTVTYFVMEGDALVQHTDIVNPDDQNNYYFTVPANIDIQSGLEVKGVFVDANNKDAQADTTQTQVPGAVAVTVAKNDNEAVIQPGAVVSAGGNVKVNAETKTKADTKADGSPSSKVDASSAEKKTDYAIERGDKTIYKGFDQDATDGSEAYPLYSLMVDEVENGSVTWRKANTTDNYAYTFTATAESGYSLKKATLVYYVGGDRKTKDLELKNGECTVDLSKYGDKGSFSHVSFTFAKNDGTLGEVVSKQAAQVIVPNTIQITYNEEKNDGVLGGSVSIGRVYYESATKDENGNITAYVFSVEPDTVKGYVQDGELTATWKDLRGNEHSAKLTQRKTDGKWELDPASVPVGAVITVAGAFKADMHAFEVNKEKTENGSVTLYDKEVKRSDKPKFTVKANSGYSLENITVTIGDNDKVLTLDKGMLVKAKDDEGKEIEGVYTLKDGLPGLKAGSKVTVSASFKAKSIGMFTGEDTDSKEITLSEYYVASGDKVTVSPSSDKVKAGYKVTGITVEDETGKAVNVGNVKIENGIATFSVPKDKKDGKLTVKAVLAMKEVSLEGAELEGGKLTPTVTKADRGELVTVKVEPKDGMKVKTGTLKLVISGTGENNKKYTEEVYLSRKDDTTYTFILPSNLAVKTENGIVVPQATLTWKGEFEPGQSDSSAFETSIGAAVAVSVVNSESRSEIGGAVTSGGNIDVKSNISGGAKTETKAGYSKGKIDIGGAVSVQVASLDSKALVNKNADVELDGKLNLSSGGDVSFAVTGDASGGKTAEEAGVGAGIAVSVNGSDVFAGIQDGASLNEKTKDAGIQEISVTAKQKANDSVTAKAGAGGGTAVVPVAAVDVNGIAAKAYVGKVSTETLYAPDGQTTDKLNVLGNVKLTVKNKSTHTILADASAAGKGAGIGAAITVAVVNDTAVAQLNQSVSANNVSVAAEMVQSVSNTANASASGGKTDGKSADKQADGMLSGAGNMAAKNKSSNVNTGNVDGVMNRQKAETSEGTVGVAGAVAVNVQSSKSLAELLKGVNVKAENQLSVTAVNGTTSKVKANAAVTNSDIGVGVGVAVNVIGLANIARLSDGEIEAAMLKVSATTKETAPSTLTVLKPIEKENDISDGLGEAVASYLLDLAKEIGLDQYVPDTVLDKILGTVVKDVVAALTEGTGLDKLLGDEQLNAQFDSLTETLKAELEKLPKEIVGDLIDSMLDAEVLDYLDAEKREAMAQSLVSARLDKLEDRFTSLDTLKDTLKKLKTSTFGYFKKNVNKLIENISDVKKTAKDLGEGLGKVILQTAGEELKEILLGVFYETIETVNLPGVNKRNVDRLVAAGQDLYNFGEGASFKAVFERAAATLQNTFKEKVFNYEKVIDTITNKKIGKNIANALREKAKEELVNLTNAGISTLTEKLNLAAEAEDVKPTGHVINTQAISGAGTRDVGVAGSVAITVLNAETSATIADGGSLTVTGDVTVESKELRTVTNVASAALDANGNADTNPGADDKSDVGSGNDAKSTVKGKNVELEIGAGATGLIREGNKNDNKPRIYITLKPGFAMPEDGKAIYSYEDGSGFEVTGIQVFTVAGAVAAGNVGGDAINVIVTKNHSEASLGNGGKITASGSAKVNSNTALDLMAISGSAALGAGNVAAGGTVNVIVDSSKSNTKLGNAVTIDAIKNVTIASDMSDQLISGTASASAAATRPESPDSGSEAGSESGSESGSGQNSGRTTGGAFAGVVNVIVSKSAANTTVGSRAALTARDEDLKLTANNDACGQPGRRLRHRRGVQRERVQPGRQGHAARRRPQGGPGPDRPVLRKGYQHSGRSVHGRFRGGWKPLGQYRRAGGKE